MLGEPDFGLFVSTYVGYWLVGLAMLAIGVVASFLTGNITIGFVLGRAVEHAAGVSGVDRRGVRPFSQETCWPSKRWSISRQFADFGRGVLSLSGFAYFVADRGRHALCEHGVDRPAALVQRHDTLGDGAATTACGSRAWRSSASGRSSCSLASRRSGST